MGKKISYTKPTLEETQLKYTFPEIQNEILSIIASKILRNVIRFSKIIFSINMLDELQHSSPIFTKLNYSCSIRTIDSFKNLNSWCIIISISYAKCMCPLFGGESLWRSRRNLIILHYEVSSNFPEGGKKVASNILDTGHS